MKKNKILIGLILLVGLAFAQKPTTRTPLETDWISVLDSDGTTWDHTLQQVLEANVSADISITGDLTVTGDATISGDLTVDDISADSISGTGKLSIAQVDSGGASVGSIIQKNNIAGETYTGTNAGLTVKNYDVATSVHGGGENTGLAVFMKQLSADVAGGESSIVSLHSHASAVGELGHGIIIYPDTVASGIAFRAAVMNYGLDFADRANVTVDTAEIRGSNGETIANTTDGVWDFGASRIQVDNIWHVYGGFEDSSATIDLSTGVWANITNATGTLWDATEADGFTMSGDTMTVTNTGDYYGSLSLTMSGANNDELYMRIYNITQDDSTFKIGFTGVGGGTFRNVAMPIYLEVTAGDELVLQLLNTDSNDDAVVRSAIFYMSYLHD